MNRNTSLIAAALTGIVSVIICGSGCSREPKDRATLETEFTAAFGFKPSTNVTDFKFRAYTIRDTEGKWFSFTCDSNTMSSLTNNNFESASRKHFERSWEHRWLMDLDSDKPNPNAPEWWRKPGELQSTPVFFKNSQNKALSSSYVYFWIDVTNSRVYAHSVGVN